MKHIVIPVLLFVVLAAWWLESRFDATVAIMVLGGALGVVCVIVGYVLSMANTKYTLNSATEFNHDLANAERYRQATNREFARGEREAFTARARLDMLDARRIDQLAQRRADLLLDLERRRIEEAKRLPIWDDDDDADRRRSSEWD